VLVRLFDANTSSSTLRFPERASSRSSSSTRAALPCSAYLTISLAATASPMTAWMEAAVYRTIAGFPGAGIGGNRGGHVLARLAQIGDCPRPLWPAPKARRCGVGGLGIVDQKLIAEFIEALDVPIGPCDQQGVVEGLLAQLAALVPLGHAEQLLFAIAGIGHRHLGHLALGRLAHDVAQLGLEAFIAQARVGDEPLAHGRDAFEIVGLAQRIQGQVRGGHALGGGRVLHGHREEELRGA
jgi:hypothetical protein